MLDRRTWDHWGFRFDINASSWVQARTQEWNVKSGPDPIRLFEDPIGRVRAFDINGDGRDDLVTNDVNGELIWSNAGSSGWIALRIGLAERPILEDIQSVHFGSFDAHPGRDLLVVSVDTIRLYSSDGSLGSRQLPWAVTDAESADIDVDGYDDVLLVHNGGWSIVFRDAIAGNIEDVATGVGVYSLQLAELVGGSYNVVYRLDSSILVSDPRSAAFTTLIDHLPDSVQSIDDIHFVFLNQPRIPGEPADAIVSSPNDGPVMIYWDIVVSPPSSPSHVGLGDSSFALDIRHAVVGHFANKYYSSAISYGTLPEREPNGERIRRSDLLHFLNTTGGAYITNRYPFPGWSVSPEPSIEESLNLDAIQGEHIPIWADVATSEGAALHSVRVTVDYAASATGSFSNVVDEVRQTSGAAQERIEVDFSECRVGRWRVRVIPESPIADLTILAAPPVTLATSDLTQSSPWVEWVIDVALNPAFVGTCVKNGLPDPDICGDGVVGGTEQCDDGNIVDGDACTSVCMLPMCGDGHLSAGEQCDDGNAADGDSCTSVCTLPVCGDAHLSAGEGCDDGNTVAFDGCSPACTIELAVCGNGVVEGLEQCDVVLVHSSCYFQGDCANCLFCLE